MKKIKMFSKFLSSLAILSLFITPKILPIPVLAGSCADENYYDELEYKLANGTITKAQKMSDYLIENNQKPSYWREIYICELDNGIKAVFKCGWSDIKSEETAYKISRQIEIGNIPATVYRTISYNFDGKNWEEKSGFMSLYIKPVIDISHLYFNEFNRGLNTLNEDEVNNFKILNFILGISDLGQSNTIIGYDRDKIRVYTVDSESMEREQVLEWGKVPYVKYYETESDKDFTSSKDFPFWEGKRSTEFSIKENSSKYGIYIMTLAHKYINFKNGYWIKFSEQYGKEMKALLYPKFIPQETYIQLKQIKREDISKLFPNIDQNKNDKLVDGIMERVNMLLKNCKVKPSF